MAEPLSAVLGIVKSTWQFTEFARSTSHARNDAKQLWTRTTDLFELVKKIDSIVRENGEPSDEHLNRIIQKSLEACNRTLQELARRCLNLGDKDDLTRVSRITRPVYFTLSSKSIQKFESDLQINLMRVQLALSMLCIYQAAMGEQARQHKAIKGTAEVSKQNMALRDCPSAEHTQGQPDSSPTAVKDIDMCRDIATGTITECNISPTSQQARPIHEGSGTFLALLTPEKALQVAKTGKSEIDIDRDSTLLTHTASQNGKSCEECLRCMHKLVRRKLDIDATTNGETALHASVRGGNLAAAKVLLEKGASVDAFSPDTPLMLAVKSNKAAFVELFLTHQADVNVVDVENWGLIHHAIRQSSVEILLMLLQKDKSMDLGMNLNARCVAGWTPIMHLAQIANRTSSLHLARTLLDHGADVNEIDVCGHSALYYAIMAGAASPQRNKFVRLLLEKGARTETQIPKQLLARFPALRRHPSTQ